MVRKIGQISVEGSQACTVYSVGGRHQQSAQAHTDTQSDISSQCIVLCDLGVGGQRGRVFSMKGTVAALSATDYKDPPKVLVPVNDEEGLCRTIKSQYYKTSAANFDSQTTFGATGVLEICQKKLS